MEKTLFTFCMAATFASGAAFAADEGFYVALDAGQSRAKDACTGIPAGFSCKNTGTAIRLGGGYQFSNNVGVELSYGDYGSNKASGTVGGVPISASLKATGLEAALVGSLPLSPSFSLTGKLGIANTKIKGQGAGGGFTVSASATSTTGSYGIGMRYDLSKAMALRAQYEDLGKIGDAATTGKSKISLLTAGLVFSF
jgi:opacity protein-like surface antigen